MEVVIGVQLSTRELKVDVSDNDADGLRKQVEKILSSGSGVLWVSDKDGRTIGVPADKLAYVEIGTDKASKRVGFSSSN